MDYKLHVMKTANRVQVLYLLVLAFILPVMSLKTFGNEPRDEKFIAIELFRNNSLELGSTASDGVLICFTEDGFNGLDWRDAPKMNNLDENLARIIGNTLISIENREFPVDNENLALFVNQYSTNTYQFRLFVDDFDDIEVFLFDNFTTVESPMGIGENIYHFNIDHFDVQSTASNRFSIRFKKISLALNLFETYPVAVFPNPVRVGSPLCIDISTNILVDMELLLYNSSGNLIQRKKSIQVN